MTDALALRTRLFAAILRRVSAETSRPEEMVLLRGRREDLRRTPVGRFVFGSVVRGVSTEDHEVVLGNGSTQRLHVHRPAAGTTGSGPLPVVLNFHGGGWCLGSPEQSDWLAPRVAARVGAVVVSPTYRLAPEHPYPAAIEDAWAVLRWLHADGARGCRDLGGDPDRLAVMGDSAGGNLAAVTALRARESDGPRIRAQVLIYPAVEMYDVFPSEAEQADAPVLTSRQMHAYAHLYMGERYGTEDWQASPLRAGSLADLPPALVLTAHRDPLRDHGTRYAARLRADGTPAEAHDYGPGIHGFASLPGVVPVARRALDDVVRFLRRTL